MHEFSEATSASGTENESRIIIEIKNFYQHVLFKERYESD